MGLWLLVAVSVVLAEQIPVQTFVIPENNHEKRYDEDIWKAQAWMADGQVFVAYGSQVFSLSTTLKNLYPRDLSLRFEHNTEGSVNGDPLYYWSSGGLSGVFLDDNPSDEVDERRICIFLPHTKNQMDCSSKVTPLPLKSAYDISTEILDTFDEIVFSSQSYVSPFSCDRCAVRTSQFSSAIVYNSVLTKNPAQIYYEIVSRPVSDGYIWFLISSLSSYDWHGYLPIIEPRNLPGVSGETEMISFIAQQRLQDLGPQESYAWFATTGVAIGYKRSIGQGDDMYGHLTVAGPGFIDCYQMLFGAIHRKTSLERCQQPLERSQKSPGKLIALPGEQLLIIEPPDDAIQQPAQLHKLRITDLLQGIKKTNLEGRLPRKCISLGRAGVAVCFWSDWSVEPDPRVHARRWIYPYSGINDNNHLLVVKPLLYQRIQILTQSWDEHPPEPSNFNDAQQLIIFNTSQFILIGFVIVLFTSAGLGLGGWIRRSTVRSIQLAERHAAMLAPYAQTPMWTFTGREHQVREIISALRGQPVVLSGLPRSGKTFTARLVHNELSIYSVGKVKHLVSFPYQRLNWWALELPMLPALWWKGRCLPVWVMWRSAMSSQEAWASLASQIRQVQLRPKRWYLSRVLRRLENTDDVALVHQAGELLHRWGGRLIIFIEEAIELRGAEHLCEIVRELDRADGICLMLEGQKLKEADLIAYLQDQKFIPAPAVLSEREAYTLLAEFMEDTNRVPSKSCLNRFVTACGRNPYVLRWLAHEVFVDTDKGGIAEWRDIEDDLKAAKARLSWMLRSWGWLPDDLREQQLDVPEELSPSETADQVQDATIPPMAGIEHLLSKHLARVLTGLQEPTYLIAPDEDQLTAFFDALYWMLCPPRPAQRAAWEARWAALGRLGALTHRRGRYLDHSDALEEHLPQQARTILRFNIHAETPEELLGNLRTALRDFTSRIGPCYGNLSPEQMKELLREDNIETPVHWLSKLLQFSPGPMLFIVDRMTTFIKPILEDEGDENWRVGVINMLTQLLNSIDNPLQITMGLSPRLASQSDVLKDYTSASSHISRYTRDSVGLPPWTRQRIQQWAQAAGLSADHSTELDMLINTLPALNAKLIHVVDELSQDGIGAPILEYNRIWHPGVDPTDSEQ